MQSALGRRPSVNAIELSINKFEGKIFLIAQKDPRADSLLLVGLLGIYVFQKTVFSENRYEVTIHVAFGQLYMVLRLI